MKNVLMASSAIVGAAVLVASPAAAQELELSAFQQFMASGGGSDFDSSDRSFGFSTNTEVHVNGSIMADNGITFGFRVEFEADSGETNNVDENSVWASGSFGKLEFGNNDGAEDTFMVNGSNSGVDYGGVGNPTANFLDQAYTGSAPTSVDMGDSGDATKITYTTPNFNGFSAGISYTPDTEDGGDGNSFQANDSGGGLNDDGDAISLGMEDHIGVGLGYDGEFNGVGVELGLVFGYGQTEEVKPRDATGNNSLGKEDFWSIGGGAAISFSGFTIAAGAFFEDADAIDEQAWAFDAGIGYSQGPWSFSVNGIISERDVSTVSITDFSTSSSGEDELIAASANVGYNLAPGVNVFVTGFIGEEDLANGDDNDIVAITSGLKLSF